jgi:hypothetical protein
MGNYSRHACTASMAKLIPRTKAAGTASVNSAAAYWTNWIGLEASSAHASGPAASLRSRPRKSASVGSGPILASRCSPAAVRTRVASAKSPGLSCGCATVPNSCRAPRRAARTSPDGSGRRDPMGSGSSEQSVTAHPPAKIPLCCAAAAAHPRAARGDTPQGPARQEERSALGKETRRALPPRSHLQWRPAPTIDLRGALNCSRTPRHHKPLTNVVAGRR